MSEIKDKIQEIMDDLKGRIRNPLILSFILVWLYHHWLFVYQILTIDKTISIESRTKLFRDYITENTFEGMVLCPLFWSFISLILYYLIAICAQAIKIYLGKRLNAYMFHKVDRGNFVYKSEIENVKKNVSRLTLELNKANEINSNFNKFKEELLNENNRLDLMNKSLEKEKNDLRSNIDFNIHFREHFESTMIYLLSKFKNVQTNIVNPEILINHYKVINGNWDIYTSNGIEKGSGTHYQFSFNESEVKELNGTVLGSITEMSYDKKNHLISFKFNLPRQSLINYYNLIRLNENEMIGLCGGLYAYFKRKE